MKRIFLAGARHVAVVEKQLKPVLTAWADNWCVLDVAAPLKFADVKAVRGKDIVESHPDIALSSDIFLGGDNKLWRQVVFGALQSNVPDDELAAHIIESSKKNLLDDISSSLVGKSASARLNVFSAACGYVLVNVELNRVIIPLCVAAELLEAHVAPLDGKGNRKDLIKRNEAISESSIELRIEMPLLEVAIEDFLGLKPGDIVCGKPGLDASFSVKVGKNTLPVKAVLGCQDDRKAIRFSV